MRKQVRAAAEWMRGERQRPGWTTKGLALKAQDMASDMGWEGFVPDEAEIEALETELPKNLPRWFKLIRYTIERASVPEPEALSWLAERNAYWQAGNPLRLSRPLLFEEEGRILRKLQKLDGNEQRAISAFISDHAERRCCYSKEEIAGRLLKRRGIDPAAVEVAGGARREAGPCPG